MTSSGSLQEMVFHVTGYLKTVAGDETRTVFTRSSCSPSEFLAHKGQKHVAVLWAVEFPRQGGPPGSILVVLNDRDISESV